MKKILFQFVMLIALASCAPVPVFYKDGAAPARVKNDRLDCEVDALAKAPVATQIRQAPPRYIPGTRYCPSSGRCYSRGGFFAGGEVYSVDVNARLRRDLVAQCMERAGYRPVNLPRCDTGVVQNTTLDPSARIPPLTTDSCVLKDDNGDWRIVAP